MAVTVSYLIMTVSHFLVAHELTIEAMGHVVAVTTITVVGGKDDCTGLHSGGLGIKTTAQSSDNALDILAKRSGMALAIVDEASC